MSWCALQTHIRALVQNFGTKCLSIKVLVRVPWPESGATIAASWKEAVVMVASLAHQRCSTRLRYKQEVFGLVFNLASALTNSELGLRPRNCFMVT